MREGIEPDVLLPKPEFQYHFDSFFSQQAQQQTKNYKRQQQQFDAHTWITFVFPTCDTTTADRLINKMKQKTITSYNKRILEILSAILCCIHVRRTNISESIKLYTKETLSRFANTHTYTQQRNMHTFFKFSKIYYTLPVHTSVYSCCGPYFHLDSSPLYKLLNNRVTLMAMAEPNPPGKCVVLFSLSLSGYINFYV